MTTPAYLISIILATLYGAVFHLYKGGDASRILLYVVSSWMGFIIGHNVSQIVGASISVSYTHLTLPTILLV